MEHYLEVDYKTGNLYQYSPEDLPGYDKFTSSQGNTSYRKYFKKGVMGTLMSAYLSSGDSYGLQLRILLETANDRYTIKIPVFGQQGRLDSYLESILDYLPNMELGQGYRVFPYTMKTKNANGKEITKRGVSVKILTINEEGFYVVGEKADRYLTYIGKDDTYNPEDPTHLPPLEFKQGLNDKWTPTSLSIATRKDFYEALLQEQVKRLDGNPSTEGSAEIPAQVRPAEITSAPSQQAEKKAEVAKTAGAHEATQTKANTANVAEDVPRAMGAEPKSQKAVLKQEPVGPANVVADVDEDDDEDLPF